MKYPNRNNPSAIPPASGRLHARFAGFSLFLLTFAAHPQSPTGDQWWSNVTEGRLAQAGTNRVELRQALSEVPVARREGMAFLVEHMPEADLRALTAEFLLENLNLAYDNWEKSPWHTQVTKELFLNDVLPYASLNEARDPWRAKLREISQPLVAGCHVVVGFSPD